jgi:hypothetical protein
MVVVESAVTGYRMPLPELLPPAARHSVLVGQASAYKVTLPEASTGLEGVPALIGTTTPALEELSPTASQVVGVEQATPVSPPLPGAVMVVPRESEPELNVRGVTVPSDSFVPTATQEVELVQATPIRLVTGEFVVTLPGVPFETGTTAPAKLLV